jgi:hypothetical protein
MWLVSPNDRTATAAGKMVFRMHLAHAIFERHKSQNGLKGALPHMRSHRKGDQRKASSGYDLSRTEGFCSPMRSEQPGMADAQAAAALTPEGLSDKDRCCPNGYTPHEVLPVWSSEDV